jgi:site-specific DNA-adenine methylase
MAVDSLINYIGHKSKIADQIIAYFPVTIRGTFYDVFAGSCVVGLSVPYPRVVCNELNPYLSHLYADLVDPGFHGELTRLITLYGLTNSSVVPRASYLTDPAIGTVQWMGQTIPNLHLDQLNKTGYAQLIRDFNSGVYSGLSRSCAYMIATIYGRNSNVSTDISKGTLTGSVGPLDYSRRCHAKFQEHVNILKAGRHRFISGSYRAIKLNGDDFVYIDPPYLASGFRYSGWTEQDERDLLEWIDQLPCGWALSNTLQSGKRKNEILEKWAAGKTRIELNKRYRKWAGAGTNTVDKKVKVNREVLILSYSPVKSFGNGLFTE